MPEREQKPADEPENLQTCLSVDIGEVIQSNPGLRLTEVVPSVLADGRYTIVLTSQDERHRSGYQPEQTEEQWLLEILDETGRVLVSTDPIDDLPEDVKTLSDDVGRYEIANMASLRGRHIGDGSNPNSVVAAQVDFLSENCSGGPTPCPEVDFPELRLLGRAGREPNTTPLIPVKLVAARYEILLHSADPTHRSPDQATQPDERWFLEGVDRNGQVVFKTAATDDIPDDQLSTVTNVGVVDVSEVVSVRAVHAAVGSTFNSVVPVKATFRNATCGPDSSFELFGPSRLAATGVSETGVMLTWFPGGGGSGELTYEIRLDGLTVASGVTELVYDLDGLEANTEYEVTVSAVDSIGTRSEPVTLTVETRSAFRCTADVVTVEIADGEVPTEGDDVILGTSADDRIDGLGGNDIICGLEGDDTLIGGEGDDIIDGGPGGDRIDGGAGNDVSLGRDGSDIINGEAGNDVVFGGPDDDVLTGGPGADQLYGEGGIDQIDGGDGADSLAGGPEGDTLVGGEGDDVLAGGAGNDTAFGGAVDGSEDSGDDAIDGGDGDDALSGASGDDELIGGPGDDRLDGGPGNDRLAGGDGENSITGGPGADVFVEPKQSFDIGQEDSVEEAYEPTATGGFFDACAAGGYLVFATGERFECNWPWFLFEHSRTPGISFEWGFDLFFDCDLTPVVIPGPDPTPQCLRTVGASGLPDNVEAFTTIPIVRDHFREAYASFRSWGMSRPYDAYFGLVPPNAVWPEITTAVTFSDDTTFRSRSTRPGLIEYGATPGLTQREITADLFSQFIYGRMIPGSAVFENNRPVLESLTEWVSNRIVNNNQPISCTLVTCSRQQALTQRRGTLLWRYMHAETGGYGFIPRMIARLAAGQSIDLVLARELGSGWERDFQAATEPQRTDLDVVVNDLQPASFDLVWFNEPGATRYEILLNGELFDEVDDSGGASDRYFMPVDPDTAYSVQVRALDAFGRIINRDGVATRTPPFPPPPGFAESAAFTVALERCVDLGGELYLDDGAEAEAGQALASATEIASGCFDFGESECLDRITAALDTEEMVNCDDDLSAALQVFDVQSVTPQITAVATAGATALRPVAQVGVACLTQPITSPCAAWAAKNLPRSPAPVASGGGVRILPLLGKAGVFLVVTGVAFLAINELLDTGLACGVVFADPDGFDPFNPDFSLYRDPEAMEGVTRCQEVPGASTIYGTIMQTVDQLDPDFDWATEGDDWLTGQLQRVCTTADRACEKEIGVYVPGGVTYKGDPHQQTGVHIADALRTGPFVWHAPSYRGRRRALAEKGAALTPPRSGQSWYNRVWTEAFIDDNPCVPSTPIGQTCDEFPFASTNQAMYTDLLPVGNRVWASLRLVSRSEEAPQRDELVRFYQQCLSRPFNVDEQFIIIAPPREYALAGGSSFGFRIDPSTMGYETCLDPGTPNLPVTP